MLRRISGTVLFALGLLVTTGLTLIATWPDLEADFYGFTTLSPTRLGGVSCPVIITADERPLIYARVRNETEHKANFLMRADVSGFIENRSERQQVPIEAGETGTVSWPLSAQDAVYNNFILAAVYRNAVYPMPIAQTTCGVYVLNMRGLPGSTVYWTLVALGLLALGGGLFLLEPRSRVRGLGRANMALARRALALTAAIGLFVSYRGSWILGLLSLVVIVLTLLGLLLIVANRETG
jgi:hypothetical protein